MEGAGIVLNDLSCKDLGARVALLVVHAQSNVILCLKYHSGCVGILVSMLSATVCDCPQTSKERFSHRSLKKYTMTFPFLRACMYACKRWRSFMKL